MDITLTVSVARVVIREDTGASYRVIAYDERGSRLINATIPRSLAETIAERLSVTIQPAAVERDE